MLVAAGHRDYGVASRDCGRTVVRSFQLALASGLGGDVQDTGSFQQKP